ELVRSNTSGDPDHEHEPGRQILEQSMRGSLRVGVTLLETAKYCERVRFTAGQRQPTDPVLLLQLLGRNAAEPTQDRVVFILANRQDPEIDLAVVWADGALAGSGHSCTTEVSGGIARSSCARATPLCPVIVPIVEEPALPVSVLCVLGS